MEMEMPFSIFVICFRVSVSEIAGQQDGGLNSVQAEEGSRHYQQGGAWEGAHR